MSLIGPAGMRARANRSNHSSAGRPDSTLLSKPCSDPRWVTRAALVAYRSSSATPSRPSTAHNVANCASLPTAITIGLSNASKTSYGAIDGCRLPRMPGTSPAAAYAEDWLTRPDSKDDSKLTSTR